MLRRGLLISAVKWKSAASSPIIQLCHTPLQPSKCRVADNCLRHLDGAAATSSSSIPRTAGLARGAFAFKSHVRHLQQLQLFKSLVTQACEAPQLLGHTLTPFLPSVRRRTASIAILVTGLQLLPVSLNLNTIPQQDFDQIRWMLLCIFFANYLSRASTAALRLGCSE